MANDLAHKINNPLQSLTNVLYLAAEGYHGDEAKIVGQPGCRRPTKPIVSSKEVTRSARIRNPKNGRSLVRGTSAQSSAGTSLEEEIIYSGDAK